MLKNPQPVSKETHRYKRLLPTPSYIYAQNQALVPLVGVECAQAVHNFPIVFTPYGESYVLMAMLSLQPDRNMFVSPDGKWLGSYIPAILRQHPFAVGLPAEGGEPLLCVDGDSDLISDTDGQPMFEVDGSPSETMRKVIDFVGELERSRAVTIRAVNMLVQHNLIIPWDITLNTPQGQQKVNGIFRIDEAAMNALPYDGFLELRQVGALPIAYAHLLSLNCIDNLVRLSSLNTGAPAAGASAAMTPAIDGNGDLVFNF
ncbi:MAG TPA: SapC family protein [Alphaproteobacteria bacterium]|nr:SapC family protein [Alphaproteobacteria bacterium]